MNNFSNLDRRTNSGLTNVLALSSQCVFAMIFLFCDAVCDKYTYVISICSKLKRILRINQLILN